MGTLQINLLDGGRVELEPHKGTSYWLGYSKALYDCNRISTVEWDRVRSLIDQINRE